MRCWWRGTGKRTGHTRIEDPGQPIAQPPLGPQLLAFLPRKSRLHAVGKIRKHLAEHAMARLAQYVLPVVTVRPEFGVLPRHVHSPEPAQAEQILAAKNADDDDCAIYEDVRRELFPEADDRGRFPAYEVGGRRQMFASGYTGVTGCIRVERLRLRVGVVRRGTVRWGRIRRPCGARQRCWERVKRHAAHRRAVEVDRCPRAGGRRRDRRGGHDACLERLHNLGSRLEAIFGRFFEQAHDDRCQIGRYVRAAVQYGHRHFREMLDQKGRRGVADERRFADEHLIRHDAQRVQVAPPVELTVAGRLLGRHVRGSADRHAGRREA